MKLSTCTRLPKLALRAGCRLGFLAGSEELQKLSSIICSHVRSRCEREGGLAGCHVLLGDVQDLNGMMKKIFDQLLRESIEKPWHEKAASFFGNRIRRVGLLGITVELDLREQDLSALAKSFGPSIQEFIKKTGKQGLLLILDDINGLAGSAQVANWLKSTVDELSLSQPEIPLCILIVGLGKRCRTPSQRSWDPL